jgi:hypothetical protein
VTRAVLFAAVCALVLPGTALATYNPSFFVANTNHALGGRGPLVIRLGQGEQDDASAMATIYAPPGYRLTLGQAPGTKLGELLGEAKIGALGNQHQRVSGTVKVDNPANYVNNTCAPGVHEAVWVLEFTVLGSPFRGPVYVDRITSGPEAAYASARIQACLSSPYVPPPQGSPGGASLLAAAFSVAGVFRSPTTRGNHAWNGVFVPYTPGTATPNPANAAQSTSIVRLPVSFALNVRRQKTRRGTFARLTACVKEAGTGVRGIRVNFLGGRTAPAAKTMARGRTNARGCATAKIRVRRRSLVLFASTDLPPRQANGCRPTLSPRCSSPSVAPAFGLVTQVWRVRR